MIRPVSEQRLETADINARLKALRVVDASLYLAARLYLEAYEGYSHTGIKNGRRQNLRKAIRAWEAAHAV